MKPGLQRRAALSGCAIAALLAAAAPVAVYAQEAAYSFNIPAQDLGAALRAYARAAHQQVVFDAAALRGRRSAALVGSYTAGEGLQRLLAGSNLTPRRTPAGVIYVEAAGPQSDRAQAEPALPTGVEEVVVTGTRIKGVAPSSPVIVLTQRDIRDSGEVTVADLIRSIPQNVASGQNPGVSGGAAGRNQSNQNLTGGTGINLRGLGPDATLTLLNGRRLAYDGFSQAVDISIIPLAAISQVQIVTDGASAIYGSDAVAGVANIMLKRDFEGLTATARYGGATDGGDVQHQYDAVFGKRWDTGGLMAAVDSENSSQILNTQRSYTQSMPSPTTLLPGMDQWSGLVSAHQDINAFVRLSLDALYADRKSDSGTTTLSGKARHEYHDDTKEYFISPTLTVDLPYQWSLAVNGLLAKDRNFYNHPALDLSGNVTSASIGCDCNATKQVEADGEGPVARLPGGDARLAVGAGYRVNRLDDFSVGNSTNGRRSSYYAFGELNLPFVSPEQGIPGLYRLTVNGAVRYESYSDIGNVATPKIGVVYSPFADLDLKASWGKSFKAPTLFQQHQLAYVALFPAYALGGSFPADTTALLEGGGNVDLKPEKADTATIGLAYQPHFISGLRVEASYFHINFKDRVLAPLNNFAAVFTDPIYAPFVSYAPTPDQQQQVLAGKYFYSLAGPYDPSKVVAVVDDSFTNVARQIIDGVDLSAKYSHPLGKGTLTLTGSASWLDEKQQNLPGQPVVRMDGTIYNPPHFRARGGLIWDEGGLTLSGFVNHQSGVVNTILSPSVSLGALTTADATGIYRVSTGPGLFRNLEVSLTVQNLFNAKPPYVRPLADYVVDYDSLNYSPVGRFISVSVSKHW